MRLRKVQLRAPSPTTKGSIITDATHVITFADGFVQARPRVGGRALVYSDFAEAETLEEFDVDGIVSEPVSTEQPTLTEEEIDAALRAAAPVVVEQVSPIEDGSTVEPIVVTPPTAVAKTDYKFVAKSSKKNKRSGR